MKFKIAMLVLIPLGLIAGCSSHSRHCVVADAAKAKVFVNTDSDGLALQGYDPVAYFTDAKAVKGSPDFSASTGEATYRFASAAHRDAFLMNPGKYEPQFGGYCAYAASVDKVSPISPEYWEIIDGRLLLQHNQKAWDLWHKDASGSLVKADRNWPGLVDRNGKSPARLVNVDAQHLALEGYDPVAYFTDAKPVKGDAAISAVYRGATYHFASTAHRDMFISDPAKYEPQFGGFCAYAASINKISPVNPEIWQMSDGRLLLQHTPEAYRLFNENTAGNLARADANWPALAAHACK